ncbi:uncharacterized protein ACNS7B_004138 isoform 2-T2 [Menidia menidia]
MASRGTFIILITVMFAAKSAQSFVKVDCEETNVGQHGHQSMLKCVVQPTQDQASDFEIQAIIWTKVEMEKPLLVYDNTDLKTMLQRYRLAEEPQNKKHNVSLLITDTKAADDGEYTCTVVTDVGDNTQTTRLTVRAIYSEPTIKLSNVKKTPNTDKSLICKSEGGFPKGELRWFDEHEVDWTKSATFEAKKMENGLFQLISSLPLLPLSTFNSYTCVVFNSSGIEVHKTTIQLEQVSPEPGTGTRDDLILPSKVVAPVVVIGSLIVGLLLLLVFLRRRSQLARRPSTTPLISHGHAVPSNDNDVEEGDSAMES